MIGYAEALRRAKASKSDWNEEERISKAVITWVDSDWEYEVEVENEDMTDSEFQAWVEEQAEELAREAAEQKGTTFEEVDRIDYEYETIDDDAAFQDSYEAYAELEWECRRKQSPQERLAFAAYPGKRAIPARSGRLWPSASVALSPRVRVFIPPPLRRPAVAHDGGGGADSCSVFKVLM